MVSFQAPNDNRLEIYDRRLIKTRFFEFIYGTNQQESALKADFTEVYPHVAEVIKVHKRKDYRFLPRLMQNLEAHFIINTVCRRLMAEIPDAHVLTIHDCLLTTPPHVATMQRVMAEEFNGLGLAPTFHVKRYRLPTENGLQSDPDASGINPFNPDGSEFI